MRVTPAGIEHQRGAQAGRELRDAPEGVRVLERSLELGLDDDVGVAGLVASGFADRPLSLGVGPAGSVGDQLAVVSNQQPADNPS